MTMADNITGERRKKSLRFLFILLFLSIWTRQRANIVEPICMDNTPKS